MKVSDIVELDKKRVKVYIDGEYAFVLYKGELRDYGVKLGEVISDENYEAIISELLPKRATKRAMNLLQKKNIRIIYYIIRKEKIMLVLIQIILIMKI